MRKLAMVTATILGLSPIPAFAAMDAQDFVDAAHSTHRFESQAGKMALHLSRDPRVRDFARAAIADHNAATETLKTAAASAQLAIPETLAAPHRAGVEALRQSSGPAFHRLYVTQRQEGYKQAIAAYERYIAEGGNAALVGYARQTLPMLKRHRAVVDGIDPESPIN